MTMTRRIGAHDLEIEGDIIKLTVHGDYSLEDMKAFAEIADAHEAAHGYVLILNDATTNQEHLLDRLRTEQLIVHYEIICRQIA